MSVLAPTTEPPLLAVMGTNKLSEQLPLPDSMPSKSEETPAQSTKIPHVNLEASIITDAMAAQLATSILGHVLFLKSQVPFPVLQLARIPTGKSNPRAAKHKTELLSAFDTISSHLITTFTSLSTAIAKTLTPAHSGSNLRTRRSRAYMAIAVGPSIGTARSKILVGFDGFESKIWGLRHLHNGEESVESEEDSDEEECESGDEECSDDDEEDSSHGDSDADDVDSPPLSRSPSPDSDSCPAPTPLVAAPIVHYATSDAEKITKAADRLLSRTLAQAEADGLGMSSEMPPSQVHVLIRAPRRFDHPSWVPQQGLTTSLDATLNEFLQEAGIRPTPDRSRAKTKRGPKIEGVWISCRNDGENVEEYESENEDDEMIWWSWNGKIVGFSDW